MAELEQDDSKRRHSFCQIGIAHGIGQGQSWAWGTVTAMVIG